MTHSGSLKDHNVSDDARDIRGTTVRGSDGRKLGKVNDVIFDHDTMTIQYLVVDSEEWLEAGTFLLPADRVGVDPAPSGGKVTLRPKPVARAEEAASGATLLKPQWWEAFENYLRENKSDIQARCEQESKAA